MKTLKMNDNWDLQVEDNDLRMFDGKDKIGQDIEMILKTVKGDNIFFESMGIPWLQIIQMPSKRNVKNAIVNALKDYPMNIQIENINVDENHKDRTMNIMIKIRLDDETTEISLEVGA